MKIDDARQLVRKLPSFPPREIATLSYKKHVFSTNPSGQRSLELKSPQIWGPDGEVWAELIKRDVTDWEKRPYETPEPKNWYKLYDKLMDDVANEVKRDAEALKARLQNLKSAREHSKQVKAAEVPPLPKMGGMKLVRNPRPAKKTVDPLPSVTFSGNLKTKGLSGGAMFKKIKREVREKSHFGNHSRLAVPTHKLSERASKVLVAPPSILYDRSHPLYGSPTLPPPPSYSPSSSSSSSSSSASRAEPKPYLSSAKKRTSDEAALIKRIDVNDPVTSSQLRAVPSTLAARAGTSGRRPQMAPLRRPSNIIKRPTPVDPFMPAKRSRLS